MTLNLHEADPLAVAIYDATGAMPPPPIYAMVGNTAFVLTSWTFKSDDPDTMVTTWTRR